MKTLSLVASKLNVEVLVKLAVVGVIVFLAVSVGIEAVVNGVPNF